MAGTSDFLLPVDVSSLGVGCLVSSVFHMSGTDPGGQEGPCAFGEMDSFLPGSAFLYFRRAISSSSISVAKRRRLTSPLPGCTGWQGLSRVELVKSTARGSQTAIYLVWIVFRCFGKVLRQVLWADHVVMVLRQEASVWGGKGRE